MNSTLKRRVKVTVNDNAYVVEVGDLTASPITVTVNGRPYLVSIDPSAPQAVTDDAQEVALESLAGDGSATPAPAPAGPTGRQPADVQAPMPGTVLDIAVRKGDRVTYGQRLCSLEAMKMKTAIQSPRDGIIADVEVMEGQSVAHGDVLFTFE